MVFHAGFRKPLIDFTCATQYKQQWGGATYNLPDQVWSFDRLPSGLLNSHVDIIKSASDLTRKESANVGLDSVGGFFSASANFKSLLNTIEKKSSKVEEVKASVSTFQIDLLPFWGLELNKLTNLYIKKRLPSDLRRNVNSYMRMIRMFGTHLFETGKFGGLIHMRLETSESYFKRNSDKKVEMQAKATFFNFLKANGAYSRHTVSVSSDFRSSTSTSVRFYGGKAGIGSSKGNVDNWQKEVARSPWLFSGRLYPWYELIQDDKKRNNMKRAVEVYVDKAYLRHLKYLQQNGEYRNENTFRRQSDALLRKSLPTHSVVQKLGLNIKNGKLRTTIPSWFKNAKLCYRWYPDGNSGQCWGSSRTLCAHPGKMTAYYRDDTDRRGGGCRMSWGLTAPSAPSWFKSVKICYSWYPDGDGGQCGPAPSRTMCANVNSFTPYYRDDTDRRGGGCRMRWMLQIPGNSPVWLQRLKLCYYWYPDGDGGQCGGGVGRHLCASPNTWTTYYRDDTDRRSGGCRMSWGIK